MGRTSDMYMLMRLSYDQAENDLADKKTDNLVGAYKKYHKENLNFDSYNPAEEVRMFYNEELESSVQII